MGGENRPTYIQTRTHLSGAKVKIGIEFVNHWTKFFDGIHPNLVGSKKLLANHIDSHTKPNPGIQL